MRLKYPNRFPISRRRMVDFESALHSLRATPGYLFVEIECGTEQRFAAKVRGMMAYPSWEARTSWTVLDTFSGDGDYCTTRLHVNNNVTVKHEKIHIAFDEAIALGSVVNIHLLANSIFDGHASVFTTREYSRAFTYGNWTYKALVRKTATRRCSIRDASPQYFIQVHCSNLDYVRGESSDRIWATISYKAGLFSHHDIDAQVSLQVDPVDVLNSQLPHSADRADGQSSQALLHAPLKSVHL